MFNGRNDNIKFTNKISVFMVLALTKELRITPKCGRTCIHRNWEVSGSKGSLNSPTKFCRLMILALWIVDMVVCGMERRDLIMVSRTAVRNERVHGGRVDRMREGG